MRKRIIIPFTKRSYVKLHCALREVKIKVGNWCTIYIFFPYNWKDWHFKYDKTRDRGRNLTVFTPIFEIYIR